VNEATSPCPCGCGAELIGMVVEREAGVRAEAAGGQPVRPADSSGIFLITEMPGAGKSTVARAMALRFDRSAHTDIDMVFHHVTVAPGPWGHSDAAQTAANVRPRY
jgi:hypothetical protein